MPTKRERRSRNMRQTMPEWAARFLETGEEPRRGTADWHEYVSWKYFGGSVPGLTDADKRKWLGRYAS